MRTTSKQRTWLATLLLAAPLLTSARKTKTVAATDVPVLTELLEAAGWTMTPERSSTYTVGDIYSRRTNSPIAFKDDCFDGEAREGAYTSLEVVQTMKAGGKVPLGMARITAKGMEYKQVTFAEPYITELAAMHLTPLPACRQMLLQRRDIEDLFVIQSVLSAEVKEQLCRTIEASARGIGFQAEASAQQDCKQASEGHVAVAYKTRPASNLIANTQSPAQLVESGLTFDADGASLGVATQLRLQGCDASAEALGLAARTQRLQALVEGAQVKAKDSWRRISGEIDMCLKLPSADRGDCVDTVRVWIERAEQMQVSIPAGEESVKTECGTRQPVFDVVEASVAAENLNDAQLLLKKLLQPDIGLAGEDGLAFNLGMTFVQTQPGSFKMGCTEGDKTCHTGEFPSHIVSISESMMVQTTEVTMRQWRIWKGNGNRFLQRVEDGTIPVVQLGAKTVIYYPTKPTQQHGRTRCSLSGIDKAIAMKNGVDYPRIAKKGLPDACPAAMSWWDSIKFANWLSTINGFRAAYVIERDGSVTWDVTANGFRLPTEAEWEYVARAGEHTVYSGSNKAKHVGWVRSNSSDETHHPAQLKPNAWGLYDMTGNVAEWCWDKSGQDYMGTVTDPTGPTEKTTADRRVVRGGEYFAAKTRRSPDSSRVSDRSSDEPKTGNGLRLVRTVTP
jgi:formylglycine-generating enzyme required for sulfatase activity